MDWLRLTPESITALVQVILAAIIAIYLFTLKNKSRILWLLAISLVGETAHHLIKLISFSVPALYQSATPLIGVANVLIFVVLLVFAYDFRIRLYEREARLIIGLAMSAGVIIAGYLLYVFISARPHDQIAGTSVMLYVSLAFLLLTGIWTILILVRKARYFTRSGSEHSASGITDSRKDRRACLAFATIFSLKLLIIPVTFLSEIGVVSVDFRIYANLVLHIVYLSGLTLVIIDHIKHPTSLQIKLVGLSLTSVLLILSIGGLSIYSTSSLLERSKQFIPDRQKLRFSPADNGSYTLESVPFQAADPGGDVLSFADNENLEIGLNFPFVFFGELRRNLFINRHGLLSFDEPFIRDPAPVFYMEQLSPPYKSSLHIGTFGEPAFIAPLHVLTPKNLPADIRINREQNAISIQWNHFTPASYAATSNQAAQTTFLVQLYDDGRIDISHEVIDVFLHEGLVGLYPGHSRDVQYFTPASLTRLAGDANRGLIFDLSRHFRAFVHGEVLPLVWLIVGSILFIVLIFPLALRSSIFRPLDHLLEGVRRIDRGRLDDPVPVVAPDEIGEVAQGFNTMMDSLSEAHRKLVQYADHLEEEVALRTDEIRRQKQVLEEQAAGLRDLDEMKSRFFANISHEFRTPLNLIMGPIQSILDGDYGPLDEVLVHRHQVMLYESKRLLRLINQLLDLSRLEAGQMEITLQPHDLAPLWNRIVHSFSSRAEMEQKTLTFQADTSPLIGWVDPERMEQIGYNLIDNALKFTDSGGKVRVAIHGNPDNSATITIQDTGCGIPPDQLEFIFDRFHRVDGSASRDVPGTGIGLALVQEFVYLHNGAIEVDSEPGFGTTFTIRLPVDPTVQPIARETAEIEAGSGAQQATIPTGTDASVLHPTGLKTSGPRVLIVDDDGEFRYFIQEYLEDSYQVELAENGRAGLEAAQRRSPHLIVSDLMMPEMDGIAFCEAIRRHPDLDHIPFILLTAKASVESRIEGLEHGADAYLSKPVNPRELRTRIQSLIEQRQKLVEKYTDMVRLGASEIVVDSADAVLLKQTIEIIESRLDDAAFSVTLLAEEMGMSVRDLQRKLKTLLDSSPKALITGLRIERAKQLLAARAGTVSQIAYKVGFSRPEYFMRIFKQQTGVTPGAYMKEAE